MRIGRIVLVSSGVLFATAILTPLSGQTGAFAFQLRGGETIPLASFGSETAGWQGESGAGPSFGMGFTFPAPGPLGAYLGFSQHRFSCPREVCARGAGWTVTGFDVALRQVLGEGWLRSWFQGGLHTFRIEGELEDEGQDSAGDPVPLVSELGLGLEVGGGVLIRVGERTSLSPGLRYGWGRVPFPDRKKMIPHYLILDLGLVLGF